MKDSSECPKCKGRKLWIVEPFRVPSDAPRGAELPVIVDQPLPGAGMFRTVNPVGRLDLYVCSACGYSELWARDLASLEHRPEDGVRLLDNTDPERGPFR